MTSKTVGERIGDAIDRTTKKTVGMANSVSDKTVDAARTAMTATRDFAGAAVKRTGEVLVKVGTAVEKTSGNEKPRTGGNVKPRTSVNVKK